MRRASPAGARGSGVLAPIERHRDAVDELRSPGPAGTMVFVASSGGHLAQMQLIADRIRPRGERRVWVTYDHLSSRSALEGREMVAGCGPSTRSLPNALRNALLARRLYDEVRPDVVLSTGAGIAVPFLMLAAQRGAVAHYIESATRTDGPSLTGRILQRLGPGVALHAQYPQWSVAPWRLCRNVFDEFTAERLPDRGDPKGLRILVTVGSRADFPFPALIDRVHRIVRPEDRVVWQIGSTVAPPVRSGYDVQTFLPFERMAALLAEVDVVVAHSGVGIALSSLSAGRKPVLVPRRRRRGEVIDDHQAALGSELAVRGLAVVREVDDLERSDLEEAAGWVSRRRSHPRRSHLVMADAGSTAAPARVAGTAT